jgi:uncharacterized protein (DUF2236 family)
MRTFVCIKVSLIESATGNLQMSFAQVQPYLAEVALASPSTRDAAGAQSRVRQYFGEWRGMLLIFRTGLRQNTHPAVSRALEQHSGEAHHALSPDLYDWAHATFVEGTHHHV